MNKKLIITIIVSLSVVGLFVWQQIQIGSARKTAEDAFANTQVIAEFINQQIAAAQQAQSNK